MADQGHRQARSTLAALRTLTFQLSGAQLGITITSLMVGFITEPTIGRALEPAISALNLVPGGGPSLAVSTGLALALATAVQMVVGELIPKYLAVGRPAPMAFVVAAPLRWCNSVFRPVIVFLNALANRIVRLLGMEPLEELTSVRSLDELGLLIESSREQGALREDEAALLSRSISFRGKTAADALVPRTSVIGVNKDQTISEMAQIALASGHSRFPVYGQDLDDVVGFAHVKDVHRVPRGERATTPVSTIMQEALVVPESRDLESLLAEMRREGKHLVVVVDEYGGTAGIVTIEDLLEEIVGAIEDEYDPGAPPQLTAAEPGIHVVSGMLHPDEVREMTGLAIPDGDYETLAGFLLALFAHIPEPGEHASFDGWELKVVAMDRHRIDKVLVVAPPLREEANQE